MWECLTCLSVNADLNKSKRRLSDTAAVKPGYLEGGASGRLPRIMDLEISAQSNRWWEETNQLEPELSKIQMYTVMVLPLGDICLFFHINK